MKLQVLGAIALMAMVGCERKLDVFGSNYDACLLQNATKGGDTDSRAVATAICQRHFESDWKKGDTADTQIITTLLPNSEQYDGTRQDEMKLQVWNRERYTTIRKMRASIAFYKSRNAKGELQDLIDVLEWPSFELEVGPEGYNNTLLTFEGRRAPSPYFEASISPAVIIPHGNPFR